MTPPPPHQTPTAVIAFCSDEYMEAPLHVAAMSVVRALHPAWLARIYVLTQGIDDRGLAALRSSLDRLDRAYEMVELATAETSIFTGLRPFHGSYSAYFRLLLPGLINDDRFLYLDTDTITTIDVSPLFEVDMHGRALGFVNTGKVKHSLERNFFLSQGASLEDPSFNSGVILFNRSEWLKQDCFSRLLDFCRAHPDDLLAADQTALNVLFARDCHHLDPPFNVPLSTVFREKIPEQGVYHFVGSPKPWDLFGEWIHPYGDLWKHAIEQTAIGLQQRVSYLSLRNWRRFPRIMGGYRRIFRQRGQQRRLAKQK